MNYFEARQYEVQQRNKSTGVTKGKTPWVSIIVSLVGVSLPPLAIRAMLRHDFDTRGCSIPLTDPFVDFLERSGIGFAGLILFPVLSFVALSLAFINTFRRTVAKSGKIGLWVLFVFSVLNCALVIAYFSEHINK